MKRDRIGRGARQEFPRSTLIAGAIGVIIGCIPAASAADDPESAFRGRRIAEANCASCHALSRVDESAMPAAPPLRQIGKAIPRGKLRQLLRGTVFLQHAAMPDFEPDQRQADDLAAYITDIAHP
jgi:cytochrome c